MPRSRWSSRTRNDRDDPARRQHSKRAPSGARLRCRGHCTSAAAHILCTGLSPSRRGLSTACEGTCASRLLRRRSTIHGPISDPPAAEHARPDRTQIRRQYRSAARATAFDRGRTGRARRVDAGPRVLGPNRRPPRRGRFLPQGPSSDLPRDRRPRGQEHALRRSHPRRLVPYPESRRDGRRRELRDRTRELDAERGQHHRLCGHRSREVRLAPAHRRGYRDCRRCVPAGRTLLSGNARGRRTEGVPYRRSRRTRTQGLRRDARRGQGGVPDPASALRESRFGDRPADRIHRSRRDDRRSAALGPDHHRGEAIDGQDRARGEHRRVCGAQDQEGGRDLLDGNVVLAARVSPDLFARPDQPAAPAHRRSRRGGMAARHQRDHPAQRCEDLHRRYPRTVSRRTAGACAPPQART